MDLTDLRTPQSAPCLSQRSQCTQNDSLESDTYSAHDSAPRTRSSFSMLASPRTPASGHDVKLDLTTARRRRRASHRARTGRERTSGVPRSLRNSILELHTGRARLYFSAIQNLHFVRSLLTYCTCTILYLLKRKQATRAARMPK